MYCREDCGAAAAARGWTTFGAGGGEKDMWAPAYQLEPAGLLEYSSTKLDPYVKITDIGGCEWLFSKLVMSKI